jgi:2-(1,2-epoxy-1,2-dihydrophenyl)acetyl-CoA isomerase
MTDQLLEHHADGIATLTMNRPAARNALTGEMLDALGEAVARLALDASVRCVVLTGTGAAFCAGGDVKGFVSRNDGGGAEPPSLEQATANLRRGMEASKWLNSMAKPTLAVIPGPAAGAGLSLALACDMRICASTAKLTTAFSKVGVSGDYGGSWFLTQIVGAQKARELFFTADVISGDAALALGIVNKSVPAESLAEVAAAQARYLAGLPTVAIGYMKRNINLAAHATLAEALDMEALHMARTMMTADHKAASLAFVEKRVPVFSGR